MITKLKKRSPYSLCFVAVIFQCQLSLANPPHGQEHGRRHGHKKHGQQHQMPPYLAEPEEQLRNQGWNQPDFTRNQSPEPEYPVNNAPPHILPEKQGSNFKPLPPSNEGGIQILPLDPQQPEKPGIGQKICPEGFGIYKTTGLCYRFANKGLGLEERSPCGSFMEFYRSSDPLYGECDCKEQNFGRPVVYWERTNQCYWLFDKGPCKQEEWIVLNDNDTPICSKQTCPENTEKDWDPVNGNKKYWFRQRGKCYKSGEKGFCEDPELNIYLIYKEQQYITECKKFVQETKTLLNGAKTLPCLPGHRASATGECKRSASFE